tara:strand:+ start:660 stop:1379 length:720 start_codon:yes stop_codon:yes gene_type:complete
MRDEANLTFSHDLDAVSSDDGMRFQREKFCPRIERTKNFLEVPVDDARVLDIGIGYGSFLSILEKDYGVQELFGMDPFPKSLEMSRKNTNADLRHGDIEDKEWPFSKPFDLITCFDVVEHLKKPSMFFTRSGRYLKPNGLVLVTTPNKTLAYHMRKLPFIGKPDLNPTHINVRVPEYWRRLAIGMGYEILDEWMGEHMTHVKFFPSVLGAALTNIGLDPRNVFGLNHFQQSFCLLIRKS